MLSASFHGPINLPSPQLGLTAENIAADGAPNGPHAAGATLSAAALAHENRQAIIARQMVLFTLSWQGISSAVDGGLRSKIAPNCTPACGRLEPVVLFLF
jgi:hypothetical protein